MSFDSSSVSVIAAIFSCVAAISAAITARRAHNYHKKINENKSKLLKLEVVVKHFNELMFTFSEIRADSDLEWSDDRTKKLKANSEKLRKTITIIGSLHYKTGNSLDTWHVKKDKSGNSFSILSDYILGGKGAIIGDKYEQFFNEKSIELQTIQDRLFGEFSA